MHRNIFPLNILFTFNNIPGNSWSGLVGPKFGCDKKLGVEMIYVANRAAFAGDHGVV